MLKKKIKFNLVLPGRTDPKLFFRGKFTINQKHSSHLWSPAQSSLLTEVRPSGAFGGENKEFFSMCSIRNDTIKLLKMVTGQQQRNIFMTVGRSPHTCNVGYVTCSPSTKYQTETKDQTNSPFIPLQPQSLTLVYLYTSKSTVTQNR